MTELLPHDAPQPKRGLQVWFAAIPGGLTVAGPLVDRLALDGLLTRAIRGLRDITRDFWSWVDLALPFSIPTEWKDGLTIATLLLFPAVFQFAWTRRLVPVAEGRLFEQKVGLFRNFALRRYLGVAAACLLMAVYLVGSELPVELYFVGVVIAGFSSMVSWKAPVAVMVWGSTFLAAAFFEGQIYPIIDQYLRSRGY